MKLTFEEKVHKLADFIKQSKNTVFFGGAGVSTDSGLADFRSAGSGLYNESNPYNYPTDRLMSREFFNEHPKDYFHFYRTKLLDLSANPNSIHYALAEMEAAGKLACIVTQNGDNLHQRAGSKNVIDLHGNVYNNNCMDCGKPYPPERIADYDGIPYCDCGGIIEPKIVMFSDIPDAYNVVNSVRAVKGSELVIVGGTSLKVSTASRLLNNLRGKRLVIINAEETPYDAQADLVIHARLAPVFDALKALGAW